MFAAHSSNYGYYRLRGALSQFDTSLIAIEPLIIRQTEGELSRNALLQVTPPLVQHIARSPNWLPWGMHVTQGL